MNPETFQTIFWIFFGGICLWIGWGFIRMFAWEAAPRSRATGGTPMPPRKSAGGAADSPETFGVITATMTDHSAGFDSSGSDSSDTGGDSDSGGDSGGGDFSGGGGESGGGGSSGGW